MPKKKVVEEEEVLEESTPLVLPITQEFGNGELNTLRDKINEIINVL